MTEYTRLDSDEDDRLVTYVIRSGVLMDWIHNQPKDMWDYIGVDFEPHGGLKYAFAPEMDIWFKLRWT